MKNKFKFLNNNYDNLKGMCIKEKVSKGEIFYLDNIYVCK